MGVSLDHWRGSIGLFHCKTFAKPSCSMNRNYEDFLIKIELCVIWWKLVACLPVQLIIRLLLAFIVCTLAVILLLTVVPGYYLFDIFWNTVFSYRCSSSFRNSHSYLVHTLLAIKFTPSFISYAILEAIPFLNKSFSIGIRNLIFFLIILQSLLVLSGTVEINPRPDILKKKIIFCCLEFGQYPCPRLCKNSFN